MTPILRQRILRINAIFLCGSALFGLAIMDIPVACCGSGVGAAALRHTPEAVIGLVEAHGLALILGVLYLRASRTVPDRQWHLAAAATHLLLGTANVTFWSFFTVGHAEWVGLIVTPVHFALMVAEAWAAIEAAARSHQ